MSLITIIAKSPHIVSWESLHNDIKDANFEELELFPIPSELGFEEAAVGIVVSSNFKSKETVITELGEIVKLLGSMGFTVTELYNGSILNTNNVHSVVSPLLGGIGGIV